MHFASSSGCCCFPRCRYALKTRNRRRRKRPEEQSLQIVPTAHGWTIHAVGVDADELLTSFAAKAQLQILIDDTVKRQITINLLDKPALDVLNIIVDAYGFSMAEVDGVYFISEGIPNSPSSYLLSDIVSVTTKYVAPSQAVQLLPVFLQGQVKINADRNAVVLSGPKPVLDKFRQDVEQFDTPAAQIMLDVNVVEITEDNNTTFSSLLGQEQRESRPHHRFTDRSTHLECAHRVADEFCRHPAVAGGKGSSRACAPIHASPP